MAHRDTRREALEVDERRRAHRDEKAERGPMLDGDGLPVGVGIHKFYGSCWGDFKTNDHGWMGEHKSVTDIGLCQAHYDEIAGSDGPEGSATRASSDTAASTLANR